MNLIVPPIDDGSQSPTSTILPLDIESKANVFVVLPPLEFEEASCQSHGVKVSSAKSGTVVGVCHNRGFMLQRVSQSKWK